MRYSAGDLQGGNYIFTTEGHPIPVDHPLLRQAVQSSRDGLEGEAQHSAAMCPAEPQSVEMALLADVGTLDPGAVKTAAGREAHSVDVPDGQTAQGDAEQAAALLLSASSAQVEQAAAAPLAGSTAAGTGWDKGEDEGSMAMDVGFGNLHSNRSALEALVCPDYAMVRGFQVSNLRSEVLTPYQNTPSVLN